MADETSMTSEEARQKGNDFYKRLQLEDALIWYKRAADLAPHDPAPLSNLSAVYFELGQYAAADQARVSALTMLDDVPPESPIKQKVFGRQAKCRLHLLKIQDAAEVVQQLLQEPVNDDLRACVDSYQRTSADIDVSSLRKKLILELPRYKPAVRSVPEYFVIGHDTPEPLYDASLLNTGRKKISLLFGGIGDARNLHATLLMMHAGRRREEAEDRLYHFTIADIKPAVIARSLVIFIMLDELSDLPGNPEAVIRSKLMPCLFYTYLAPVMPRSVYDVLQKRIWHAIDALEGRTELPVFFEVPPLYRREVIRVLKEWQHEAPNEYTGPRMRREASSQIKENQMSMMMSFGPMGMHEPAPGPCKQEEAFYFETGLLPCTSGEYKLYRPELRACMSNFIDRKRSSESVKKAIGLGDSTWAPNVTQVDLEWQRNKPDPNLDIDLAANPFEFAHKLHDAGLPPKDPAGLYDYAFSWFGGVAASLHTFKQKIKIEACVGDITAVLEQVRHGIVGHRSEASPTDLENGVGNLALSNREEYPPAYDRIHLSNIPDYIGGTLSSFLYALPLTYPGKSSYVTSTCLRNPPRFPTVASFNDEYIALSALDDLVKTFQVRMEPLQDPFEIMPMCEYRKWHHKTGSSTLKSLLPRAKFETWLFRLFLKLAIPKDKHEVTSTRLIYSPLNLTVFFRLIIHLHSVGYPAHWLSGVLEEILSGKIMTGARPPRSEPLAAKEIKAELPSIEQSLAPFMADITTIAAMWVPAFPFGIVSPKIPPVSKIHKYRVSFDHVNDNAGGIPTFTLVFYNADILRGGDTFLRPAVLSDELADASSKARLFHRKGLHVITMWEWDRPTSTATWWLREDVMNAMKSSNSFWEFGIWRTDNWRLQISGGNVALVQDLGRWIDF